MGYITKHWRGEFSLARSWWVNLFCINIIIILIATWLTNNTISENPVRANQIVGLYTVLTVLIIYPWQIIGTWRCAKRHIEENNDPGWARFAQIILVLGILGTFAQINSQWTTYTQIYHVGFGKDEYGNYKIEYSKDTSLIHLTGPFGFGISEDVNDMIEEYPSTKGIILDSIGGWIYEGRELSKVIIKHKLKTYSLAGCYSACGTAFIAGSKRYLGTGANLGFHKYKNIFNSTDTDMPSEQKIDLILYKKQGVSQIFLDRIFNAESNDLWYPTTEELLTENVVHEIINPSDIMQRSLNKDIREEALKTIAGFPLYQTISEYDPLLYKQIINDIEDGLVKGMRGVEIQQLAASYTGKLLTPALQNSSNTAITEFVTNVIKVGKKLEQRDPILCMKYYYPEQYGPILMTNYFSIDELLIQAAPTNRIIIEKYTKKNTLTDKESALRIIKEVVTQMGEEVNYLDKKGATKEEYSRICNATNILYQNILNYEVKKAGNTLRYLFASE
ncbi:MAG: hypothetical protein GXP00_07030 [Alphaproteobacteria bacterium]|nr:hypothetical protein [Alphaproteobacteria bacterium]